MRSLDIPRPRRPIHWVILLLFLAGGLAWLSYPLPTPAVEYAPTEYERRTETRDLDLTPTRRLTLATLPLDRACEEQDVVLGRDFLVDGERLHAHILHLCGSETLMGARVVFEEGPRVVCQETYGGQAKVVERYSRGTLSGTSATSLQPVSLRLTGKTLCAAAHGVEVLDGLW